MTKRIAVSATEHQAMRFERYAVRHGASVSGALLALAVRQLEQEEQRDDIRVATTSTERPAR